MNLFQEYKDIDEVKKYTSDSVSKVKSSIIKYQFFMDVFHVLSAKHNGIVIEDLDYLPMVDRFMGILVGNDTEVGLSLSFNEGALRYSCSKSGESLYNQILLLVGEAFLLRKEKNNCTEGELAKIVSSEIRNAKLRKALILEDIRIPGLLALIRQYKTMTTYGFQPNDDVGSADRPVDVQEEEDGKSSDDRNNDAGDKGADHDFSSGDGSIFIPQPRFRPRKRTNEYLSFAKEEAGGFESVDRLIASAS